MVEEMNAQHRKYESHTANLIGAKIHYLKAGTGTKKLVLIHGFGDTSHMLIPLFEEFGRVARPRMLSSSATSSWISWLRDPGNDAEQMILQL